jgi:lipopolysaccharide transport system ATP-binding protein
MSKQEVQRKFDEIVNFAEIEKFVDTPVKRYSSGMYVRLAFAVAAHLESEILLVDEVLAVGDAEFQKKCLGKMGDVASKEGRTVLFVSHNMVSINHLCDQALLFQNGNMIARGESADITNKYLYINDNELAQKIWSNKNTAPGNEIVRLHAIRIVSNGKVTSQIPSDQEVILEVDYWNMKPGNCLVVEVRLVESSSGYVLEAFNTQEASGGKDNTGTTPLDPGLYRSKLRIPPNFLNDKHFMFHIMLVRLNPATAEINMPDAISFSILDTPKLRTAGLSGKWMGPVRTTFDWSTELVKKE